jgi:hypothetical protein
MTRGPAPSLLELAPRPWPAAQRDGHTATIERARQPVDRPPLALGAHPQRLNEPRALAPRRARRGIARARGAAKQPNKVLQKLAF